MTIREVPEAVAETYDFIEKLLAKNGKLYNQNKVISNSVLNALTDLYEEGQKAEKAKHEKSEIVTP